MSILKQQQWAVDAIAGVIPVRIAPARNRKQLLELYHRKRGDRNMEYLIVFSVAAMMGLYVLILARCLREA